MKINKTVFTMAAVSAMGLAAFGCQKKSTSGLSTNSSVADISPTPSPSYTPYSAPAPQPVMQPVSYDTTTASVASSSSVGSGSYTVKKGDTLYSIAKNRYGTGKEYTKIVSANPGLSPQKLRVGQTIQIP